MAQEDAPPSWAVPPTATSSQYPSSQQQPLASGHSNGGYHQQPQRSPTQHQPAANTSFSTNIHNYPPPPPPVVTENASSGYSSSTSTMTPSSSYQVRNATTNATIDAGNTTNPTQASAVPAAPVPTVTKTYTSTPKHNNRGEMQLPAGAPIPPTTTSTSAVPATTPTGSTPQGPVHGAVKHSASSTTPQRGLVIRTTDEELEDGRIRNREAVTKIRDAWIYKQIRARAREFTRYESGRIFLGTWNVNAKGKDENLDSWLCQGWGPNGETAPDIVAVGLQEMVDLNAVNVAVGNKSSEKSQFWVEQVLTTLNSQKNSGNNPERAYKLLSTKHLVGLLLCVFVKAKHKPYVKHVHEASVGVGVMGVMGNKGGVSIRLQFYDSTICIVNSHLAAHRENVVGRNADFHNVYSKLNYDIGDEAVLEVIRNGSLSQWATGSSSVGISDHDMTFWIGDLNYRIHESMETRTVLKYAETNDLEPLKKLDQLNIERAAGRVFRGFEEGALAFAPTYKYQPGTDLYEQRPDKKLRAPAWCDRILWMTQDQTYVNQLDYSRSELNVSDHKPVMSTFRITVKVVIENEREKVYNEVMKILDQYENKSLPMVGLDKLNLDFGEVRYNQTLTLPINVTNTGKVAAQFRLVPKLDEPKICKPWMSISPTYGMLIPGEKQATINFTITVDNQIASALNSGREILEDIIILRLENGRDYYITVTGRYARSCFGMSVDDLVMYTDPIREVPLDPIKRAQKYRTDQSPALCVPKELWQIVNAIYEKGLHEPDLFNSAGFAEEMYEIRECLDTGAPFGEYRIHSMAEVLISFLTNLSTPIVPPKLFPTLELDSQNIQAYARKFLEELPPIHYNVFVYITSFFRECLLYKEGNQLSTAKLARICYNCLVVGSSNVIEDNKGRRDGMIQLMYHFLETSTI